MQLDHAEIVRQVYQESNGLRTVLEVSPIIQADERTYICSMQVERREQNRWSVLNTLTGRGATPRLAIEDAVTGLHHMVRFAPAVLSAPAVRALRWGSPPSPSPEAMSSCALALPA